ncbi:MAG: nitrile hydratase subunit beta [Gammaproteobacteria bacterium]|nr:nitrile hydratase subunit beta [Gammaproteobacteria bacterium]
MNSNHDLGGRHGFGPIKYDPDDRAFHERWESRVFGISLSLAGRKGVNLDQARYRGERLDPVAYFANGYFGRWLAAFELMLHEEGFLADGELEAWLSGVLTQPAKMAPVPRSREMLRALAPEREVAAAPRFDAGQAIVTRNHQPAGHTRLPAYARCRRGEVTRVHAAMVFADTNAVEAGENPQYVYTVAFDGRELWGEAAEPATTVCLDLFESYLEAA